MLARYLNFTLAVIVSLCSMSAFAQSPGIEWQKLIGGNTSDFLNKTLLTSDSSMVMAGVCSRSSTGSDIRICKLGQDGKLIWNKYLGGSSSEGFSDLISTPDGGFMLIATTLSSDGDVVGFHGPGNGSNYDIWIVKLSAAGAIQWQKSLGGSGAESVKQSLLQPDGSLYLLGTSGSGGDFGGAPSGPFVAKLNQNGVLVFANILATDRTSYNKMIIKPNGNILLVGSNINLGNHGSIDVSVIDYNPVGNFGNGGGYGGIGEDQSVDVLQTGAGQYTVLATSTSPNVSGNHGGGDLWLLTFNASANLIWQKSLGGSGTEQTPRMYFNNADSTITIFASTTSNDGDVSGNHGGADVWVTKLSNAGALLWQRCLGGSGSDGYTQIQMDATNQIYLLGTTTSNDGDVSGNHGNTDAWFVKLDASGSPVWQKCLGGTLQEKPVSFNIEPGGFTLLAATPSNDGDVKGMHYRSDTIGINILNKDDIWVVNLNNTGAINWTKALGGYDDETPNNVFKIKGKYFVTGSTKSNNGDISGLQGTTNMWAVRLGLSNTISGSVFYDANSNGIKDAGEAGYDDVIIKSEKNNYARWSIPYNGRFKTDVDTGSFTTSITLPNPYFSIVPVSQQSTFGSYFLADTVDFALQPMPGKRDIAIYIFNTSAARPGFNSYYTINYKNLGTDTIALGKVYMRKDSNTVFVSAVPAPDVIMGDSLIWNYSNLTPNTSRTIAVTLTVKAPPKVNTGDTLQHWVSIEPDSNDLTPENNRDSIRKVVTGSFDPNDKSENHAGYISLANAASRDELHYVINFQNVGTDTAFTIVIRDTLNNKLDWNTLQITGASHPATVQITDGNKYAWTFSDIKLPPSGTNEPASHGYIAYSIKPIAGLTVGNNISNSAAIYFDYNPAVITNTVVTTVQPDAVSEPIISGLVNNYCNSAATPKIKLINPPSNGTGATTTVKLDNTTLTVAADSTVSFVLTGLAAGTHTLSVSYSNLVSTKTTTANFTVMAAATPDVNVTANITTVTNLTNPVIVTAVNASGGGKSPLFTFAWNNSFTNIIQMEGSNNMVTIAASSFALGDNKVYVKMKTSEACYSAQTNIDSISVRRDQATGIVDIDNPGQVINVYPNPVNGPITVNGLSSGKSYTLTIVNLQGQVVFTKRVVNQNSTNIIGFKGLTGTYLLTIFDEKKNRTLGTVQLIKK